MKHHWSGGLAALGFGPGRLRTLVSMATDSSHRVIMGEKLVTTLAPWMSLNFGKIPSPIMDLAALERLKNQLIMF